MLQNRELLGDNFPTRRHRRPRRSRARPRTPGARAGGRPWLDPKLLAAAKKEGPLTVYSSTNEQEGLPLFKIFEDATGIKFNYIRGNDASLISRIAIETRAKQPSFDIVHMTNAHKMPQALLAQFDPSEAKHINPLARDPDRRWYGVYTVYTTPAYNTKLVPRPTCRRASRNSPSARNGPARSRSTTPTSNGCAA